MTTRKNFEIFIKNHQLLTGDREARDCFHMWTESFLRLQQKLFLKLASNNETHAAVGVHFKKYIYLLNYEKNPLYKTRLIVYVNIYMYI